jgi:hypothetical protein
MSFNGNLMHLISAVRSQHKSQHIGIEVYYYFDGECTDPKTKQQISNNFIERLKASLYQDEACPNSMECNKGNVHVRMYDIREY